MQVGDLIEALSEEFESQKQTVNHDFRRLSHLQLNWRPAHRQWSIVECIEHLNLVGRHYYKQSLRGIESAESSDRPGTTEYQPHWIGRRMIKVMAPADNRKIRFKMKTFSEINPTGSHINAPITLDEFVDRQDQFIGLFKRMENIDINQVKVTSVLPFLKLRLGDALRFTGAHQARHLLQAERVKSHPSFPQT
jgi:hypothetical protein